MITGADFVCLSRNLLQIITHFPLLEGVSFGLYVLLHITILNMFLVQLIKHKQYLKKKNLKTNCFNKNLKIKIKFKIYKIKVCIFKKKTFAKKFLLFLDLTFNFLVLCFFF